MASAKVVFEKQTGPFIRLVAPAPAVSALVDYYILIEVPPGCTNGFQIVALPGLHMLLSVPLTAFRKSVFDHLRESQDWIDQAMLLGSLQTAVTCTYPPGAREFAVKFKPGVLPLVCGLKAAHLSSCNLPAKDYLPEDLLLTLGQAGNMDLNARRMDAWLEKNARSVAQNRKLVVVASALAAARAAPGRKLPELAASIAMSAATLNRYCREILDLSASRCFSLLRFRDALELYRDAGSRLPFEELGYADFSHFAKEARKLTRTPPKAL
ncbi:hypothetical protein C7T94_08010 [Pedobacter yulinensis]|uniref:HTH araC/xylS-type domain-containing protein n=1 Tax=Pedobacter yulinensis TaxID=2126353 RepID=A0A2T3HJN9_9SPHI|nr:helix-turn-helix domain-containing protein [Pedobacter yulinensis]PST82601.1 hypothetical protein C7T94_08010 [Pedobacter yulinensis]